MFKKEDPKPFYNEKYEKVRQYLPRLYINLDLLLQDVPDIKNFDLKVIYTNNSIIPMFIVNGQKKKDYLKLGASEQEVKENPNADLAKYGKLLHIGYKHFDKCKLYNGQEVGDLHSAHDKDYLASKRIKKQIQRQILGWKYWVYKMVRKV